MELREQAQALQLLEVIRYSALSQARAAEKAVILLHPEEMVVPVVVVVIKAAEMAAQVTRRLLAHRREVMVAEDLVIQGRVLVLAAAVEPLVLEALALVLQTQAQAEMAQPQQYPAHPSLTQVVVAVEITAG